MIHSFWRVCFNYMLISNKYLTAYNIVSYIFYYKHHKDHQNNKSINKICSVPTINFQYINKIDKKGEKGHVFDIYYVWDTQAYFTFIISIKWTSKELVKINLLRKWELVSYHIYHLLLKLILKCCCCSLLLEKTEITMYATNEIRDKILPHSLTFRKWS